MISRKGGLTRSFFYGGDGSSGSRGGSPRGHAHLSAAIISRHALTRCRGGICFSGLNVQEPVPLLLPPDMLCYHARGEPTWPELSGRGETGLKGNSKRPLDDTTRRRTQLGATLGYLATSHCVEYTARIAELERVSRRALLYGNTRHREARGAPSPGW